MEKKVIWLASYPKSGNTWFRIILSNLMGEQEIDINDMEKMPISSSRPVWENYTGFDSSNFFHEEAGKLRPITNDLYAQDCNEITFRKCHDAYTFIDHKTPLLGSPEFHKAIYIIRNPLSIVASLANHNNVTIDKAIQQMADESYSLNNTNRKWTNQLRQKLFSWNSHVESWTNAQNLEKVMIRYEDLFDNSLETLRKAIFFTGLEYDDNQIMNAYHESHFEKVKQQENKQAFKEKPPQLQRFFRKGRTDSWKEELTPEQAGKVIKHHWRMMEKYNYLSSEALSFTGITMDELKEKA
ncbi:MAG: sulfotransferase domain-containing protein [Bacteroidales bacterium]|nr:sulfotransferase domain-containing protein [Bacteroidales bacterium]